MEIYLPTETRVQDVTERMRACESGDIVSCSDEALFEVIKAVMVREKLTGLTIQLLDSDEYVLRTVTSKRRSEKQQDRFTDRQEAVIRALEKVLAHCEKEGIQLVGFSDELVAIPAHMDDGSGFSAAAVDIDTSGIYRGADSRQGIPKI
ncbi:hypothetical protein SAMN05421647_103169 [Marinobacterium stanieri]|uniref:Uncharacterized protein n=2 Tax=Marinobacterium stanieri TaxID=49186 RepID=A0A1N6R894_9GAMM|nr:hypothetical protein SAMN05421647_103169 [Marinobacterium stanieri]